MSLESKPEVLNKANQSERNERASEVSLSIKTTCTWAPDLHEEMVLQNPSEKRDAGSTRPTHRYGSQGCEGHQPEELYTTGSAHKATGSAHTFEQEK